MNSPIQAGLLAYGMSGRIFHAPFLAAHPGFQLRAITERSRKLAATDYPAIISYDSVEELLKDPVIQLVVVNTPNDTHFALAKQALQAGKHVLIEKPVGTTSAEITELFDLGRQLNLQVFGYQNRRWDSDFQAVRQVVESGQLGQLIEAHFRFERYKMPIHTKVFKEDPTTPGAGLSFDLGPHVLDQALSLFGKPEKVHKTLASHRFGSRVDDYFHFHLSYPGGLNVFVSGSLLVAAPGPAYVLHGTQGSYKQQRTDVQETQLDKGLKPTEEAYGHDLPGSEGALTVVQPDGEKSTTEVPTPRGNYMGLFEAVYQSLMHGRAFPVREEELFWQLQALEQTSE
ncbi:Predicted dehydrogenase [Hymenobacter gelipurpurascens]|uniref:Predicted dehydrogenase n=1 Tax=Hymenobacter gelipurpurascens TaxID=89968 RepID=A0A212SZS8_9BACT|nr:Gfo/Idh/MocA family oxidoreductase [Hymenobacter gelipurpurascens]SNC59303.1 Predicted dehydrogenase [Hymenobacter gelipurpurascens]